MDKLLCMSHRPVTGSGLPTPAGPYSPGVLFDRLVFVSAQGARDPQTGQLAGPEIEEQTEQCLKNIAAILDAAGSGLPYVLRCGVFMLDAGEFSRLNEVYGRMFAGNRPARTTIQVAAFPSAGMKVQIDCVAYVPTVEG